jgi:lysozyme family protein
MSTPAFASVRAEYATLWRRMAVRPEKAATVDAIARRLVGNKPRYLAVAKATGVPWFIIAVLHERESGADFRTHLHNGDPLIARTHHVPAGRPLKGNPPFTWEESAEDALRIDGLDKVRDWSVERACYQIELYNGFGYRRHGIASPYLWSFSNNYQQGKYVADGQWSAAAVDKQCGTMPMLRRMMALDASIAFAPSAPPKPAVKPKHVGIAGIVAAVLGGAWHFAQTHPWTVALCLGTLAAIAAAVIANRKG